jgi:transcription termination factor 2
MSSKLEKLVELVNKISIENKTDKIIIVSQWNAFLNIIASYFEQHTIGYCEINGTINLAKRNQIVQSFNEHENLSVRIMLLSLTAGGVGLNLVGANHMFLLDVINFTQS